MLMRSDDNHMIEKGSSSIAAPSEPQSIMRGTLWERVVIENMEGDSSETCPTSQGNQHWTLT
ncbi:16649_t:CDS:2 [Gigaspora margarita]|uniref:16649_t:CDS:1 n=1 Tax=Gigaspora margarita TaxID=4874 RepID=A0ABN7UWQ6_GIGMA|nr:16649_t:CDS:2 [Gigaspora margarita]